jgi:hypothetical protein
MAQVQPVLISGCRRRPPGSTSVPLLALLALALLMALSLLPSSDAIDNGLGRVPVRFAGCSLAPSSYASELAVCRAR